MQPLDLVPEIPSELIIPVSARTLEGAEALLRCIRDHSEHAEALSVPLRRYLAYLPSVTSQVTAKVWGLLGKAGGDAEAS